MKGNLLSSCFNVVAVELSCFDRCCFFYYFVVLVFFCEVIFNNSIDALVTWWKVMSLLEQQNFFSDF